MKNVVKISISVAMMTFATVFFSGCNKDNNTPSLVSGEFNGKVSATVDPEEWDLSPLKQVVAWNSPEIDWDNGLILGEQISDPVSFANNKFTINLPDPPPSQCDWVDIKYALENYLGLSGTLKCSDPNVQLTDCDFLAATNEGLVGYFINSTADKKTTCFYVYAEKDVTITGGTNITVSLKAGWNRVYQTKGGNGILTTKAPEDDMMWYYYNFLD